VEPGRRQAAEADDRDAEDGVLLRIEGLHGGCVSFLLPSNPSILLLPVISSPNSDTPFLLLLVVTDKQIMKAFDREDAEVALGRSNAKKRPKTKTLAAATREAARWFYTAVADRVYPEYVPPASSSSEEEEEIVAPAPKKRATPKKTAQKARAASQHVDKGAVMSPEALQALASEVWPRESRSAKGMVRRVWRRRVQRRIGLCEQNKDSVQLALRNAKKINVNARRPAGPKGKAAGASAASARPKAKVAGVKRKTTASAASAAAPKKSPKVAKSSPLPGSNGASVPPAKASEATTTTTTTTTTTERKTVGVPIHPFFAAHSAPSQSAESAAPGTMSSASSVPKTDST
jgi:hypothetical protein